MEKRADKIRAYAREKYVLPARDRREPRFSIRTGDIVRELKLQDRVRAVCTALKAGEFQKNNGLRLVGESGPPSGQSTTVVYTYEFSDSPDALPGTPQDAWTQLRGSLKDIYAEYGGGEAYLRQERESFYADKEKL
jgi:hypothetical protein